MLKYNLKAESEIILGKKLTEFISFFSDFIKSEKRQIDEDTDYYLENFL